MDLNSVCLVVDGKLLGRWPRPAPRCCVRSFVTSRHAAWRMLKPVERALARNSLAVRPHHRSKLPAPNRKNRILSKLVMVVEGLVAEDPSEYALAHQCPNSVLNEPRVTPIGEAAQIAASAQDHGPILPPVAHPRSEVIAFGGHRPAIEFCEHCTPFHRFKFEQLQRTLVCIGVLRESTQLFEKSRLTPCALTHSGVLMTE